MPQMRSALILVALLLAGLACNLSAGPTPLPSPNVASQVARLLTAVPSLTPPASASGPAPAAPSAQITLTPTPTLTLTAVPSLTPPPSDPSQTLGKPDWQDTFQDSTGWDLSGGNPQAAISGGKLVLSVPAADQSDSDWWRLDTPKLTDFYLEGTAAVGPCHGLDRYGLVVRAPSLTRGYLFGFSCDGRYSLRKWDGKNFTALRDWSQSSFILSGPGQTNRLGFLAKGNQLSLYANGNLLGEVEDSSYSGGRFGVFLASVSTPNFSVAFSQLDYWNLP